MRNAQPVQRDMMLKKGYSLQGTLDNTVIQLWPAPSLRSGEPWIIALAGVSYEKNKDPRSQKTGLKEQLRGKIERILKVKTWRERKLFWKRPKRKEQICVFQNVRRCLLEISESGTWCLVVFAHCNPERALRSSLSEQKHNPSILECSVMPITKNKTSKFIWAWRHAGTNHALGLMWHIEAIQDERWSKWNISS